MEKKKYSTPAVSVMALQQQDMLCPRRIHECGSVEQPQYMGRDLVTSCVCCPFGNSG